MFHQFLEPLKDARQMNHYTLCVVDWSWTEKWSEQFYRGKIYMYFPFTNYHHLFVH